MNAKFGPSIGQGQTRPLTTPRTWRAAALCVAMSLALGLSAAPPAAAHPPNASDASALSALPLVVSATMPMAVLASAGAVFTVAAVEASAVGTVWVLVRASDGLRVSITLAGRSVVAAGAALSVVAVSTGWVLVEAGATLSAALCFIPNEIGASLLYNEQLTR